MTVIKKLLKNIKDLIDQKKFKELKEYCQSYIGYLDDSLVYNYHGIACLNLKLFNEAEKSFLHAIKIGNKNKNKIKNNIQIFKNLIITQTLLEKHTENENIIKEIIEPYLDDYFLIENLFKSNNFTKNSSETFILNLIVKKKITDHNSFVFIFKVLNNLIRVRYDNIINDYLANLETNKNNKYEAAVLAYFFFQIQNYEKASYYLNFDNIYLDQSVKFKCLAICKRYNNEKISAYRNYIRYFLLTKNPEILLPISGMFKFNHEKYHTLKILKKISQNNDDNSLSQYYFGLAKIEEDCKNFKKSQSFLKDANFYKRKNINIDLYKIKEELFLYRKNFNKLFYNKFCNNGLKDAKPIFILGLPRSGSSLVEQIISSHSKVNGYGELKVFNNILKYFFNIFSKDNFEKDIKNLNEALIKKIGQMYIDQVSKMKNSANTIFTDKMPFNFYYLGLIKTVFPESKIIITKRNLKDNFVSIFKNYFGDDGLSFAYSENDIIKYFSLYVEHINFYNKEFENAFYILDYDDLVENFEVKTKDLLNYCDLDFEESCINFYKSKNLITTLSTNQVRKKVYTSSKKIFQNFDYQSSYQELDKIEKEINF